MIALRSEHEIAILREACRMAADVLVAVARMVSPGVTTEQLDQAAAAIIREKGGVSAFLGYNKYPKHTCISVDEVIVHGIPGKRKLKEGQLVSIDVGVRYRGYHGDAALTIPCGKIDAGRKRLLETTDRALARGIRAAAAGNYLEEVSRAIQDTCEAEGFSVVRNFVGHGIGTEMHEEPQIPNFVTGKRGPKLRAGMVLAIEPMVNMGTHEVKVLSDGWTAVTADGKPSAHFEHTIVVREGAPEILSETPNFIWGRSVN